MIVKCIRHNKAYFADAAPFYLSIKLK